MLAAHLVPGYFAATKSQSNWKHEWSRPQRILLWTTALLGTVLPDLDVLYNAFFRGFFNHSILWTHSIFVYLGFGLLWSLLHFWKCCPYLKTAVGLLTLGGFSHLLLDVIAHGTPLLYPISMTIFSVAPKRVAQGGIWAYLTDPIFLIEPALFGAAIIHWIHQQKMTPEHKKRGTVVILSGLALFAIAFLVLLSPLQRTVAPKG